MAVQKLKKWIYRPAEKIDRSSLHIQVIADYGGHHTTDHAFAEVRNHFYRFDKLSFIKTVTEHPVYAFSTLETGFWIAQEGLHSEHKNLVIFSNTAPRGDIAWAGEERQSFVCGILDSGIPVFAVHAGYNLSFVKDRLKGLWEVRVPNTGTQFRSRDFYPEATMKILRGQMSWLGEPIDIRKIPDVPLFRVASIDGYGNLKTTFRRSNLTASVLKSPILRVVIDNVAQFVLNSLVVGKKGKIGDLCMVVGSSGGKNRNYLEFVKMQGRANVDFKLEGPRDDMGKIKIEAVRF